MRLSAKAFLVDAAGRLLLLDCVDPARPDVRWWELPGGGVEVVRVSADAVDAPALTEAEKDTILGQRWWSREELARTSARFFPRHVPSLLPRVLVGERVDEAFDDWELL